ncbi:prostaglandin E2 receptor EP2 subtype [Dryobates pubescens]|nr:prostaglandin E2 receptor EP2 subtype [Dryobates pubescens]
MNGTGQGLYDRSETLPAGARPLISAFMFSAGLLGNLLALGLLLRCRRGPRARPPSLFHVLVLALVVTDLLGTCSVSPFVLASYHHNRTLTALAHGGHICLYFGFAMSFFGLATMLILFAMALERCLALGWPYFYERFLSPRTGLVALPAIYTFSAAFCSLPLVGFGRYVQYCPGTWCFIQMRPDYLQQNGTREMSGLDVTFSLLYATLLLFLILSVLLCNLSVIANLARMHQRGQRTRRLAVTEQPRVAGGCGRRMFSMAEEIDHLLLLSIMTITFVICSLPFTIRAYVNKFSQGEDNDAWDLLALRFLSINSIIDPWVFAILRPPVLRFMRSVLCCQVTPMSQDRRTSSPAKTKLSVQLDPCVQ